MRRISIILTRVFLIFFLFSCESGSNVKLGFLIPASVGYRWPVDQRYVEAKAKEEGIEVLTLSAENDENLQLKQASDLLKQDIDVLIVVAANSTTAAAIVREAHEYNVPVIGYDRLIRNSELDYLVTFEGAEIGNLMVNHALENKPKGNYVLLWGDAGDVNAIFIKEAQEATLKPYIESGDISIVYKGFTEDWSKDNAYFTMRNVLSFYRGKIDAIITSYDGLAMGALQAIEELDYPAEEMILTGQDAELDAIKAIVDGRMTLSVYKSIRQIAEASVELAIKLVKDQKVENIDAVINNGRKDVPTLYLKPIPVEKHTIHSTVIADEFYTEEQVFGEK
ncbi:MAG TPA: substrate-binding domain-containing protein [Prolixibacteraceae bacterium]|nr:substrate-binding domain-containing protein [Prolixibacteraceae bacterium]